MSVINTKQMDLNQIGDGQIALAFGREMEKVIKNIDDPNTEATTKREIVIKMVIKPSKNRKYCDIESEVRSKLAPTTPKIITSGLVGFNANNQLCLNEFGSGQIPGQMDTEEVIEVNVQQPQQNAATTAGFKAQGGQQ